MKGLNLIRRDSIEAKLDDAAAWADLLDWKLISELNASYTPLEEKLRQAAAVLLAAKIGADGEKARQALIEVIKCLETDFDRKNAAIIALLSKNLGSIGAALGSHNGGQ